MWQLRRNRPPPISSSEEGTAISADDGAVSTLSGSMEQMELPMAKRSRLQTFVSYRIFPIAPLLNRDTYDELETLAAEVAQEVHPFDGPEYSASRRKWTLDKVQQMRHNCKTAIRNAMKSKCALLIVPCCNWVTNCLTRGKTSPFDVVTQRTGTKRSYQPLVAD